MEHEVVPCSFEICDWLLNLSHGHFVYIKKRRSVRVTMELEVPEKPISRPTLFTIMVQWVL